MHLGHISDELRSIIDLVIHGKVYTTNPDLSWAPEGGERLPQIPEETVTRTFPSGMQGYQWWWAHDPSLWMNRDVSHILGRCYEAPAMEMWTKREASIDFCGEGMLRAHEVAKMADGRIRADARDWFYAETRQEQLALGYVKYMRVAPHFPEARELGLHRRFAEIMDQVYDDPDDNDSEEDDEVEDEGDEQGSGDDEGDEEESGEENVGKGDEEDGDEDESGGDDDDDDNDGTMGPPPRRPGFISAAPREAPSTDSDSADGESRRTDRSKHGMKHVSGINTRYHDDVDKDTEQQEVDDTIQQMIDGQMLPDESEKGSVKDGEDHTMKDAEDAPRFVSASESSLGRSTQSHGLFAHWSPPGTRLPPYNNGTSNATVDRVDAEMSTVREPAPMVAAATTGSHEKEREEETTEDADAAVKTKRRRL